MSDIVVIKREVLFEALVPSDSCKGAFYHVSITEEGARCTCPNHQFRGVDCKHITRAKEVQHG